MSDPEDVILRNKLKNWGYAQRAPENGRARLLWTAAHRALQKRLHFYTRSTPTREVERSFYTSGPDWSRQFFAWAVSQPKMAW
jgi:hypothetical protein